MHICFLTNEYPKEGFPHGGIGSFVQTLAKELVKKGIEVSVIGMNYTQNDIKEIVEGVKVYRLKKSTVKGMSWYFNSKVINNKIKEIHKQNAISIVEASELDLAFINKIREIKYIIRLHGGHHFFAQAENRKTEWWKVYQENRSFRKADHILAVSNYVAQTTRILLKLGNNPIHKVYNPIDSKKFYQCDTKKIKKHTIFFAGTIIEKKGIRQLVQSLNYLVEEYPDIHLYIAGRDTKLPGMNIDYRPILEKEINSNIRSHITFLGVIPNRNISNYIETAEVCCYPSHMEAMPLAWLEVLAMGKIFIGSKTGPGPEAVIHNKTGLLCNPHFPKDIAEKIKWVFDNPDKAIKLGEQAREETISKFDIEIVVQKNIEFYNEITE